MGVMSGGGCMAMETQSFMYWFDMAEYDLATARAMLATKRFLYVGFMCHQVIEKSLKAIKQSKFHLRPYHIFII